jgi:hypothetical protein
MLASTVQFSNNDQPPVTTHRSRSLPGPALRKALVPSDTQQRARHPRRPLVPFHAEAVLGRQDDQVCRIVNVPPMSNQRESFARVLASGLAPKDSARSAP